MWGDICDLLTKTDTVDKYGNRTTSLTADTVCCKVKSVRASEFYQAASTGLKASIVIAVRAADYNDQERLRYDNKEYKVLRTYAIGDNMELTCSKEGVVDGS